MVKKILIVDDDRGVVELYRDVFNEYEILIAENGEEGLYLAKSECPDLIITDKNMPKMNGYEMVKELRSMGYTKPIIGCGDFSEEEQKILDGFVMKGLGISELERMVKTFLRV